MKVLCLEERPPREYPRSRFPSLRLRIFQRPCATLRPTLGAILVKVEHTSDELESPPAVATLCSCSRHIRLDLIAQRGGGLRGPLSKAEIDEQHARCRVQGQPLARRFECKLPRPAPALDSPPLRPHPHLKAVWRRIGRMLEASVRSCKPRQCALYAVYLTQRGGVGGAG